MGELSEVLKFLSFADQGGNDDIIAEGASVVPGEPPQDETGPPEVNSEVEVLHEKVRKQIIKEVHYRAWTKSTQHKFQDTWQEQQPLELVIGKEKIEMNGLAIGISNMKSW
ncbi:Peptidyl-prolyl cis-trans isomerase FKBP42 [Abeliophyllum distichum]|uniref:Rotamase n=1 Tax=Abeliophyllum distichum TaxID=126358 RepID=A0ABD1RTF1_9LAMI